MSSGTKESVRIDASPGEVLDVIVDVESYPQWSPDMKQVSILEDEDGWPRRVRFTVDAGVVSDTYVLEYDWDVDEDGAGEVSWTLVESAKLRSLDGQYVIEADDEGTMVTYSLTVDVAVPLPGMLRRKAEKSIVSTALTGLRRRVQG
ncbi:SRPBCC family protein [Mobilicoccus caccae]|uniref:Coenzyme Q-binding protein COQ10 START domain-containing protein n=1 Tax=Mobilicoccus caccae TaxID=1859295 RepID=A0ABQ6ISW9_9MICO|nr:SRPBCC family protein [Mobilicoccus caccae]GMA39817.1 hypothetical protein GCM10025883_18620 [Mobilicoccus caccae]